MSTARRRQDENRPLDEVRPEEPMGEHMEMMRSMKERTLWTYFVNITLGLWLMASPVTLGYSDSLLIWSDVVTGAVVVALGLLALTTRGDFWGRWGICFAGIWLLFAPLVAWAPDAASYANDTIVGSLLIGFSVLFPMMPGMAHHMAMMAPGPEVPPGWSYNPSTFWQRGPVIAMALVAFLASRYLAAFQLGHLPTSWDPFFGDATERVLLSDVSKAWPISDAGLGALSYLLEALSGFMGGVTRWRTMPWMVFMFGVLVIPLGAVSIFLVIAQPVLVGEWCTLCLFSAALMLVMIPLSIDEVWAMVQFMAAARREGQPFWRTFFVGGTLRSYADEERPRAVRYSCPMHPRVGSARTGTCPECGMTLEPAGAAETNKDTRSPHWATSSKVVAPQVWGLTLPWNLLLAAAVGLWVMAGPDVFGVARQAPAADSDHLVGALIVVVAVISWAEIARPCRFLNILLGAWLVIGAWLLPGGSTALTLSDTIGGLAVMALSIPRGAVRERYDGWQRYIR